MDLGGLPTATHRENRDWKGPWRYRKRRYSRRRTAPSASSGRHRWRQRRRVVRWGRRDARAPRQTGGSGRAGAASAEGTDVAPVQILEESGVELLRAGYTGKSEKKETPYQGGGHPSYYATTAGGFMGGWRTWQTCAQLFRLVQGVGGAVFSARSEEHTSELQS